MSGNRVISSAPKYKIKSNLLQMIAFYKLDAMPFGLCSDNFQKLKEYFKKD